jgi:hypothetical protein
MAAEAAEREKAAAEKAAAEKAAAEKAAAEKAAAKPKKMRVKKSVVEDEKIIDARKKIQDLSFSHKGKNLEIKKFCKVIADALDKAKEGELLLDLWDMPMASNSRYENFGREEGLEDLLGLTKLLDFKCDYSYTGSSFYLYSAARKVYSARVLEGEVEYWNDSAEDRGEETLTKKSAIFNGQEFSVNVTSNADAKHDAAIWRALGK